MDKQIVVDHGDDVEVGKGDGVHSRGNGGQNILCESVEMLASILVEVRIARNPTLRLAVTLSAPGSST